MTDHLEVIARLTSVIEGQHAAPYPADYRGAAAALFSGLAVPAGAACYLAHDGHTQLSAAFFCLSTILGVFLVWTILPRKA